MFPEVGKVLALEHVWDPTELGATGFLHALVVPVDE